MSEPIVQGAPKPHINLSTDFGHSPIGKFGEREVTVGETPTHPRTKSPPVLGEPPSLGSRFLNWISPSGVRAESKARQSLHDFSEQLSETLGTISKLDSTTPEGKAQIQTALSKLFEKAEPMIDQGVSYGKTFSAQLELKLSLLSQDQLATLKMGVVTAMSEGGLDPKSLEGVSLKLISGKVDTEQLLRVRSIDIEIKGQVDGKLGGTIDKIIDHLDIGGDRSKLGTLFETLDRQATELAEKHGPSKKDSPKEFAKFKAGLLKEALQHAIGDEPDRAGKFMESMPPDMLKSLVDSGPVYSSEKQVSGAKKLVSDQVEMRAEKAQIKVLKLAEKLTSHSLNPMEDRSGPVYSPTTFAKEVIEFQKALKELTDHSDKFGLPVSGKVDQAYAQVLGHLDELLDSGQMTLTDLSTPQFGALRGALKALDIHGLDKAMETEGKTRRETAVKEYDKVLDQVFKHGIDGKPEDMLKSLDEFTAVSNRVLETYTATGDKIEGSDDLMRLRYDLLDDYMESLSGEKLIQLYGVMNTPEMRALIGGMQDVANSALNADKVQGPKFFTAAIDLQLLKDNIEQELKSRDVSLPPLPDETEYTAESLSDSQKTMLREVYGMTVEPTGVRYTSGLAPKSFQDILQRHIQSGIDEDRELVPQMLDDESTGVVGSFWRDLGRATYRTDFDDGRGPIDLVNRQDWNSLDTEIQNIRREAGIDQLKELLGEDHDPDLLLFISDNIHQGLLAGIEKGCLAFDGPIKLPDGTVGTMGGKQSISYTFSKDDEGNIGVQITYKIDNADTLLDTKTGDLIDLDPTKSRATFTFGVTITPEKEISLSDPVRFSYTAVRDES